MKTMKFFSMAALALVGAVMIGCTNDDNIIDEPQQPVNTSKVETLTTTISLDGGATTRALTDGGVKTFAAGDQIALVYKNNSSETVVAVSEALPDGDYGKSATFTFTLEDPDKTQDVTYIYPASMANADGTVNYDALATQDGTLATISSSLDVCTYSNAWDGTALPTASLANELAICKFTVKESAGSTNITENVTCLTVKNGSNIYTVNTSSLSNIWVAMKPVTTGDIKIYAAKGKELYKKTVSGKALDAGKLYPINVTTTKTDGALSGLFTINAAGDLVYFSQGNLRYASSAWSFFDNQYDCYTTYDADAWDKFGWSANGSNNFGISTSNDNSDYSGSFVDWGNNVSGTWSTPSNDAWLYIFNTRSTSTVNGTDNARFAKAHLFGTTHGVILFSDNYVHPDGVAAPTGINATGSTSWNGNTYSAEDWAKMEAAGAVFLPAAGYRSGTDVSSVGNYGYYWSSTAVDESKARNVYFGDYGVNVGIYLSRYYGQSVRLVGE